jgi:hypothetical protein
MSLDQPPATQLRFVVLFHQVGPKSVRTGQPHFDWMFESDGQLRTWATAPIEQITQNGGPSIDTECESLPKHRLAYLDYEGEVSGSRGVVSRKLAGCYRLIEDRVDCFRAALQWLEGDRLRRAEVQIYRSFFADDEGRLDESRASWRLRFSAGR